MEQKTQTQDTQVESPPKKPRQARNLLRPGLKMADLTPEEQEIQREYLKLKKREYRDRTAIFYVDDWTEYFQVSEEGRELDLHVNRTGNQIIQELGIDISNLNFSPRAIKSLGWYLAPPAESVSRIVRLHRSFEKKLIRMVRFQGANHQIIGDQFADVMGDDIIKATQKYNLVASPTFAKIYREVLEQLDEKYSDYNNTDSIAVHEELKRLRKLDHQAVKMEE